MELDKFHQFVKDGKYEPNLTVEEARSFVQKLPTDTDDYIFIRERVNLSLDMDEIFDYDVRNGVINLEIGLQTMKIVNLFIEEALNEIEDIEEVNETEKGKEEEDCMDTIKRHWELER